jgi:hypothetical protein
MDRPMPDGKGLLTAGLWLTTTTEQLDQSLNVLGDPADHLARGFALLTEEAADALREGSEVDAAAHEDQGIGRDRFEWMVHGFA